MVIFWSSIKKHKIVSSIFFLVIIIVIVAFLLSQLSNKNLLYTVTRENLINTVLVNGTYTIASQVSVNTPANGIISQLYVHNGEYVKKGQALFHVQSVATSDQQKAAYTSYQKAIDALQSAENNKQSLDAAMWSKQQAYLSAQDTQNYMNSNTVNPSTSRNYTDIEKLSINNAVIQTQKDFQSAEQAYKTAYTSVSAAQAAVSQTKQAYQETQDATVTAPAPGKIINLASKVSDEVFVPLSAAEQTTEINASPDANSPVLVIANYSNPVIVSAVDQANIPRLTIGQKASIVFDALPDQTFEGVVTYIDAAGVRMQGTTDFNVYITVNNVSSMIRPNMTASITIQTARRDDVLTIPNDAIVTKKGKTYVQQSGHSQMNLTPVVLGLKGLTKTEVVSGLSSGDTVIEQP